MAVRFAPYAVDDVILCIATAYDTYGSIGCGCLEVELYRRPVGDGKGDIAIHIGLRRATAHAGTCGSGYVDVIFVGRPVAVPVCKKFDLTRFCGSARASCSSNSQ